MRDLIPADWLLHLEAAIASDRFAQLSEFVASQRAEFPKAIYPPETEVFAALDLTPYASVRAVILGQDPYHGSGQAHGLAFSVRPGTRLPPSLRNILTELENDLGRPMPRDGSLIPWARHGVLLLNTVLTVRGGAAGSHRRRGWEQFTGAVIAAANEKAEPIAFLLWGKVAQAKADRIDSDRHALVVAAHPSYSGRGFLGTHPFTTANTALIARSQAPIDWDLRVSH